MTRTSVKIDGKMVEVKPGQFVYFDFTTGKVSVGGGMVSAT